MAAGSHVVLFCFGVMAYHPRSAFHGPNSVVKSLVSLINSSGDIAMYRFCVLAWNWYARPPFGSFWGIFFPPIVVTSKRTFLGQKHVVWAIQRKNQCDGSTWVRARGKNTGQQISHKSVIFSLFGGSPHWTDSTQELRGGWSSRRNHVC